MVKFQSFCAKQLVTADAEKADYQNKNTKTNESQLEMIQRLELTREMHLKLIKHCDSRGIQFFSTAFDVDNIDLLVELGQDRFKIPSGEITNLPYLRYIASFNKPLILSTGMSTLEEVGEAIEVLEKSGTSREKISILHCNTEYPTPMEDVNLKAMTTIKNAFGVNIGYSDHTSGIEVAIAAVALGACIIEKHFTLDRNLPGPDHKASLEPDELKAMVSAIRNVEIIMGDGIKRPSPSESKNMVVARKSIVAAQHIEKGTEFTKDNITVKRPGNGISPMRWDEVIGDTAKRDFAKDELIEE